MVIFHENGLSLVFNQILNLNSTTYETLKTKTLTFLFMSINEHIIIKPKNVPINWWFIVTTDQVGSLIRTEKVASSIFKVRQH